MTSSEDEPRAPFREWPAAGRWAVYTVIVLVLAVIVGVASTTALVRRPLPDTDGTVTLGRLTGPAEIRRDRLGVPHVYAADARDLFLAQGYAQAQDRFFAMDVARHRASGRLAELLGKDAVPADLIARTVGWHRLAEREFRRLAPTTQSYLRAFAAGVNSYLAGHGLTELSVEYSLLALTGLNYKPAAWTPVDSLAVLKAEASTWRDAVDLEVDRARLAVDRDAAQVDELYPEGLAGSGADAFAVSGALTESGAPLVAGAPAASTGLPSSWVQVGLHCETRTPTCPYDVAGATYAGVPGVLVGHNGEVAWTLGRSDADVTDLYLEDVSDRSYARGEKRPELVERDELIRIEGAPSVTITVRSTDAGPLISDVSTRLASVGANAPVPDDAPERGNGYAVALAATELGSTLTADALFELGRARNADDVRVAAQRLALPGHDLVFADRDDRLGRVVLGPLPRRRDGETGKDAAPAWKHGGWLGRGTAQVAEANPVDGVAGGSARVRSLISDALDWTAGGLAAVQTDTANPIAPTLVPVLLRVLVPSHYYAEGQRLLAGWDFRQPAGSAAAAYFNAVWASLLELTFHDQLRISLWPDGGPRWMAIVVGLLDEPNSPWWDDVDTIGDVEDRDDILAQALRDARDELTRTMSRDPGEWRWGRMLYADLDDRPLQPRDLGLLGELVDRGRQPLSGGPGTPAEVTVDVTDGWGALTAAGVRFVADLGDPDGSRWVSMSGASGHAFAGHYRDQTAHWADGRTFGWPFSEQAVRKADGDVLRLRPRS